MRFEREDNADSGVQSLYAEWYEAIVEPNDIFTLTETAKGLELIRAVFGEYNEVPPGVVIYGITVTLFGFLNETNVFMTRECAHNAADVLGVDEESVNLQNAKAISRQVTVDPVYMAFNQRYAEMIGTVERIFNEFFPTLKGQFISVYANSILHHEQSNRRRKLEQQTSIPSDLPDEVKDMMGQLAEQYGIDLSDIAVVGMADIPEKPAAPIAAIEQPGRKLH